MNKAALSLLAAVLVAAGAQAAPAVWHVSPEGDDAGAGTREQPFATLRRALEKAGECDTIRIAGGNYFLDGPLTLSGARGVVLEAAEGETPVFRGSIDLRDASGQMIEDVTKSTRRKKEINDEFLDELFEKVTSDYHLDEVLQKAQSGEEGRILMKKMPAESKALLAALVIAWVLIILYVIIDGLKKLGKR